MSAKASLSSAKAPKRAEALDLAQRAVSYLYDTDLDFVVGGCSDVSEVLAAFLRHRGYQADPVYGVARKGKEGWFMHAWVDVEGERFDPVLWVQVRNLKRYSYKVEPEVAQALRCDVEYILEGSIEELDKVLE